MLRHSSCRPFALALTIIIYARVCLSSSSSSSSSLWLSIINFDGAMHRRLSGILVAVFRPARLQKWLPLILHKADQLVDTWAQRLKAESGSELRADGAATGVLSCHSQVERDYELLSTT